MADNENNADDAVEQTRDGDSLIPKQSEDASTPFSPPTDPIDDASDDLDRRTREGRLDMTYPETDTNIDSQEVYDEGLAGAAEAEEPNAGNSVVNYDPDNDQRANK
jgi:hypothetical protein